MSTYPKRASLDGLEIEIFKLVSKGATPEQWAEWLRVPLEHAAAQGNQGLVDKLLGTGADGSAGWKGCGGRSLLYAAAVGGSEGVVSSVLRAGAQTDVNVLSPAPSSLSPLYQAASGGHEAAARLLIHAGADVNFADPEDGHTALHHAIMAGHEQLANELITGGADVEARDWFFSTPLDMAAHTGLEGVLSTLLLRGVDKNAVDSDGNSALMCACCTQDGGAHPAVVETLLAAGADFNIRSDRGYSALDLASASGSVPSIQALLRHGADVNSCDDIKGLSALHSAACNDQECAVNALIEAGADIELRTNIGRTPLCAAAEGGNSKALLALLQKGAIISVQDSTGCTPLHLACFRQHERIGAVVDILLRWGADETALDSEGNSPNDLLDTVYEHRRYTCSQDEIERVRLLLARAPADRAWRRRGWLAMLRSRASRSTTSAGVEGAEGSEEDGGGGGEGRKLARSDGSVGVGGGEGGQTSSGRGDFGPEMTGAVGNGVFGGAVVGLVGVRPEGVFRTVLEFL